MTMLNRTRNDELEMAAFLARELESKDPRTFTELYAGLRARKFIPKIPNISVYDSEYSYEVWAMTGQAEFIGEHAKDLPRVEVGRRPFSRTMRPLGASMGWSVLTLRGAMQRGIPIEDMTVKAAATVIARKVDKDLAIGDSTAGYTGLCNDAGIITDNSVAPVGTYTTAANKLDSLNKLIAETRARVSYAAQFTDEIPAFGMFHILMPPIEYAQILQTPASASYPDSIYDVFMRQNREWCSGIDEWSYLQTIHSGGKPRAVCYPLNDMALGAAIAEDEFVREPAQFKGLDVSVPAFTSSGGTVIRHKPAFSYMLLGS
jgi:hypothetical protein